MLAGHQEAAESFSWNARFWLSISLLLSLALGNEDTIPLAERQYQKALETRYTVSHVCCAFQELTWDELKEWGASKHQSVTTQRSILTSVESRTKQRYQIIR